MHDTTTKKKRKQRPKKGKVIRLTPGAWSLIEKKKKSRETIAATVERLLGLSSSGVADNFSYYILPESGIVIKARSLAEAKGTAVLLAAKRKRSEIEKPLEVRVVG